MKKNVKLTEESFWDDEWKDTKIKLPYRLNMKNYTNIAILNVLKHHLKHDKKKKVIELGAAMGPWLIFFNENFGYQVTGIEYSKEGTDYARKNLKKVGIPGKIVRGDLFKHKFKKGSFDVVFSSGLIEHFTDQTEVMKKHVELAKKNGKVVVIIPNLEGIGDRITYTFNKEFGEMHYTITADDLKKVFNKAKLKVDYVGYVGGFNPRFIDWDKVNNPLLLKIKDMGIAVLRIGLKILPKRESSKTSPLIIAIGTK